MEKYDSDFEALAQAEAALKEINLRRHLHNPEVKRHVQSAREAVVDAHNALLQVEQADPENT